MVDATFRDPFHAGPVRLLQRLGISQPVRLLPTEYSMVVNRRPDWVAKTADGLIYHLEFQSKNDPGMDRRMFDGWYLIDREYGIAPHQFVLYAGDGRMNMPSGFQRRGVRFRYQVVDLREFEANDLLESDRLEDNLLSVLCRSTSPRGVVDEVATRLAALPRPLAGEARDKLAVLCRLRRSAGLVDHLESVMPIQIDLREFPETYEKVMRDLAQAESRGQSKMLRLQLEQKFGRLPAWASKRVESGTSEQLTEASLRVLKAKTLRDVFPR